MDSDISQESQTDQVAFIVQRTAFKNSIMREAQTEGPIIAMIVIILLFVMGATVVYCVFRKKQKMDENNKRGSKLSVDEELVNGIDCVEAYAEPHLGIVSKTSSKHSKVNVSENWYDWDQIPYIDHGSADEMAYL